MNNNIKLVGVPEPEAPPQPTYPRTNLQFGPIGGGFAIQILLADDIAITKAFTAQAEDDITDLLIKRRKEVKQQLEMVRNIERSKNH
jgi:hypothetical protein